MFLEFLNTILPHLLPHLFALATWVYFFYNKRFPLGKIGFAIFLFFLFPAFKAGTLLGIKLFTQLSPLLFLGFTVFPTIIFLSETKIARFTPLIVVSILLFYTLLSYCFELV